MKKSILITISFVFSSIYGQAQQTSFSPVHIEKCGFIYGNNRFKSTPRDTAATERATYYICILPGELCTSFGPVLYGKYSSLQLYDYVNAQLRFKTKADILPRHTADSYGRELHYRDAGTILSSMQYATGWQNTTLTLRRGSF